jgi:hypothetical protein
MSLTVHYSFEIGDSDYDLARERIEALRQRALELLCERVGDIQHFVGDECAKTSDRLRWFGQLNTDGGEFPLTTPDEIIGFSVNPGEGCESAEFGLRRVGSSYGWQSFCKTAHSKGTHLDFLRCHLSVIAMLDHAQDLGLLHWVDDESNYWVRRDWADVLLEYRGFDLNAREVKAVNRCLIRWFGPPKEMSAAFMKEGS